MNSRRVKVTVELPVSEVCKGLAGTWVEFPGTGRSVNLDWQPHPYEVEEVKPAEPEYEVGQLYRSDLTSNIWQRTENGWRFVANLAKQDYLPYCYGRDYGAGVLAGTSVTKYVPEGE